MARMAPKAVPFRRARPRCPAIPALLAAWSCGPAPAPAPAELAERYAPFLVPAMSYATVDALRPRLPYERIELVDFNPWLWGGDRVELRADETAWLWDADGVRRGHVSFLAFARLCYVLELRGLADLEPRYESESFDAQTVTLRAWPTGGGAPIEVEEYAAAGPIELWEMQRAVDGVAREVRWDRAPEER
jgi:hypothetical protein